MPSPVSALRRETTPSIASVDALARKSTTTTAPAALTKAVSALPPPDWDRVFSSTNARVLCLGEDHTHPEIREALCEAMTAAKQAAFTHIALEMFYSDQSPIAAGAKPWCAVVAPKQFHPESYVDLVSAAKSAGLVPIGIDKRMAPATRDPWMRDQVHRIVDEDPTARVLVLVGYLHLEQEHQMDASAADGANLFERKGLAMESLRFLTGDLVLDDAVAKAGRGDEDLYIPVAGDRYRGAISIGR